MYRVLVEQHFDAAHYLRGYQGKCEGLHGHRFRVIVGIECLELDEIGLAYDFTKLKSQLGEILARFDHACLNDISTFESMNPSSENIARAIYDELSSRLYGELVSLSHVEVWESPESHVVYEP